MKKEKEVGSMEKMDGERQTTSITYPWIYIT